MRKQIIKGVLVSSRIKTRRQDGSYVQFNQNRGILIQKPTKEQLNANNKMALKWAKKPEPIGTRIDGPICKELRQTKFKKMFLQNGGKCL